MAKDAYTKLYIKFNGADAATTYTAETGQTVTFAGSAQLDTGVTKFGASSLMNNSTGAGSANVPDSDDWCMGTGDFTYSFWVYTANSWTGSGARAMLGQASGIGNFTVYFISTLASIVIYCRNPSTAAILYYGYFTFSYSTGTWYHIEITRVAGTMYAFIDGVSQTITLSSGAANFNMPNYASALYMAGSATAGLWGWMDDVVVIKGIGLHTSNFTKPNNEYRLWQPSNKIILL